jgi:hypothetical protein
MNWTCLVYGGPIFFVLLWWIIDARKWFKGPKVNVKHLMLGREDRNVLDGGQRKGDDWNSDGPLDPKSLPAQKRLDV